MRGRQPASQPGDGRKEVSGVFKDGGGGGPGAATEDLVCGREGWVTYVPHVLPCHVLCDPSTESTNTPMTKI